eukprot:scaffold4304_cov71-Cylindrotheca_fusiformis.AAC.3
MGKNSDSVFRKAFIVARADSSVGTKVSPPGTDSISFKMRSESGKTILLSHTTNTGTVPFGFNSQNQLGFPPEPYKEISSN